jgi:hypothetical protein
MQPVYLKTGSRILDLNDYQMPLFSVDIEEEIGNIL